MKWGILGPGNIAAKFAATITAMNSENQHLAAVASRTKENAQAFAGTWNIPAVYDSYEALAADPEDEAVYIATPNSLHKEHTLLCLKAGKHVLCEKPFTTNAADAEMLYQYAAEHGLFLLEGLWTRFLPAYAELMTIIRSRQYGSLIHARADYGFAVSGPRRERKLRSDLGGGALLDIGIYNLGFLTMLMEEAPVSFASSVRLNEYGTDSFSAIELFFSEERSAHAVQSIGTILEKEAAVFLEHAQILLPDFQNAFAMTILPEGSDPVTLNFPPDINGFEYEIRNMTQCIEAGCTSSTVYTPEDSIALMKLLDEIRGSWNMKFSFEE